MVGQVLQKLVLRAKDSAEEIDSQLVEECMAIAHRLFSGVPDLTDLSEMAEHFNLKHLQKEISRMESAVESDPALAIGTAKELIDTCCKTILRERGITIGSRPEFSELTKATFGDL